MVRNALLLLSLAVLLPARAQDDWPATAPLLVRGSIAISPGFMTEHPVTNIYVGGKLEVFTDERMSLRGETLWYIGAQQETPLLGQNSQVAFGPFYHWTVGHLDIGLGIEPGISLTRPELVVDTAWRTPATRVTPNIALCGGLTYSVWKYFQFFVDVRYVHGRYTGPYTAPIGLDETILGAGLGWQFYGHKLRR